MKGFTRIFGTAFLAFFIFGVSKAQADPHFFDSDGNPVTVRMKASFLEDYPGDSGTCIVTLVSDSPKNVLFTGGNLYPVVEIKLESVRQREALERLNLVKLAQWEWRKFNDLSVRAEEIWRSARTCELKKKMREVERIGKWADNWLKQKACFWQLWLS